MGKASRDKGARFERQVVHAFNEAGLPARRVPLSGATNFAKNDVEVAGKSLECKKRANLPAYLQQWGEGADGVVMCEDRGKMLVVLTFEEYCALLRNHVSDNDS